MKQDRKLIIRLGIVNLVLVIAGLAWTVYSLFTAVPADGHTAASAVIHVCNAAALIVTAVYCLTGYRHGTPFGTAVFSLCAASAFITAIAVRHSSVSLLSVFATLSFGILMTLALAPKLGRKKSYILCVLNVALAVIRIPVYVIATGRLPGGMAANLLLAIILGIIVRARCEEARHGQDAA